MKTAHPFTVDPKNSDVWICPCGNSTRRDGFDPSSPAGSRMQPERGTWAGDYVCNGCEAVCNIDDIAGA